MSINQIENLIGSKCGGKRFLVENELEYSVDDMLVINEGDEDVVDWLNRANVGDVWPGIVTVTRIQ